MRLEVLQDDSRRLGMRLERPRRLWPSAAMLMSTAGELRGTLVELKRWIKRDTAPASA